MKIRTKDENALKDSPSITFEMTPERQEKFKKVSMQIVDLLRANTKSPPEAYMLMCFIMDGFESAYGIRGGIILDDDDVKPKA